MLKIKDKVIYKANQDEDKFSIRYKNPVFFEKKYARIFLEVTGVRMERLQDISEEDAIKEGFYLRFAFERLQIIETNIQDHKRRWISEFEIR